MVTLVICRDAIHCAPTNVSVLSPKDGEPIGKTNIDTTRACMVLFSRQVINHVQRTAAPNS